MRKIGIAGFIHETNTFSIMSTPLENFLNQSGFYPKLLKGKEMFQFSEGKFNIVACGFMVDAHKFGFELIPLVWAGAEPSRPLKTYDFEKSQEIMDIYKSWKTTSEMMQTCDKKAICMHCLTADRGYEVNNDVMDKNEGLGWRSAIFD